MLCKPALGVVCASIILVFSGCGDSGTSDQKRQPDLKADFTAAADALAAKTGAPGEKDTMPPADDPAVKAFEAQSGRAFSSLGTDALPIEGFESYDALCAKSANIVGAYALAGTKGTAGAAQQQRMERNITQNFDAFFTPLLFSARCNATHMAFLEGELDVSNTNKVAAVKQVRDGLFGQVAGLLQIAGDPSVDATRRQRVLELLANDGSKFATGLSLAQRQQVSSQARQVAGAVPEGLRPQLDKLRSELAQAPCQKICSAG